MYQQLLDLLKSAAPNAYLYGYPLRHQGDLYDGFIAKGRKVYVCTEYGDEWPVREDDPIVTELLYHLRPIINQHSLTA